MVELWPGVVDCCKPLPVRRSFGVLFPFEEWLGFVTVFATTAFFVESQPVEGAFLPFFFSFASHVSDFVEFLVPGDGLRLLTASRDAFPHVFCLILRNVFRSCRSNLCLRLSRAVVVVFANCDCGVRSNC